ncbi:unnamed protein product [Owenia fusiformis]|uniref:Uncharacterized protein n=1 Tax=Owenia fusiformis TaxID=6347 RepID=A0A8J1XIK4_OWEFU|nr:unnamed protein product [Owenia fusiformis]
MDLMMFVLLGLILATCTSAVPRNHRNENLVLYENPPPKCCTPYQWHANITQVQVFEFRHRHPTEQKTIIGGHMWFDGKDEKTALRINVLNGGPQVITIIQDFKANKRYGINNEKKTCNVMPTVYPKPERCIPDDAEFLGEEILGKSLKVNSWKASFKGKTYQVGKLFTMTDTCIPVTSIMAGELSSSQLECGILMTTTTSNFIEGIKDFSIFDIPDYCNK